MKLNRLLLPSIINGFYRSSLRRCVTIFVTGFRIGWSDGAFWLVEVILNLICLDSRLSVYFQAWLLSSSVYFRLSLCTAVSVPGLAFCTAVPVPGLAFCTAVPVPGLAFCAAAPAVFVSGKTFACNKHTTLRCISDQKGSSRFVRYK